MWYEFVGFWCEEWSSFDFFFPQSLVMDEKICWYNEDVTQSSESWKDIKKKKNGIKTYYKFLKFKVVSGSQAGWYPHSMISVLS